MRWRLRCMALLADFPPASQITLLEAHVLGGSRQHPAVTPATIQGSQIHPLPPTPVIEYDYFWADSAYSGECFNDHLSLGGFESLIHE